MADFSPFAAYPTNSLIGAALNAPFVQAKKRRAFFSFHYDDIMRVNVVRNAWKIDHPDSPNMRSFYDSSLWESRKLEGAEALKRLIREGVDNTSAICVLIGSNTWSREWVRYEIARAVIDNRGLLGVHINNINQHQTRGPNPLGNNPFAYLGLYRTPAGLLNVDTYCLYEHNGVGWYPYQHYSGPVDLPAYLLPPSPGYIRQLSHAVPVYDFINGNGAKNIGAWIDEAAQRVSR